MANIMDLFKTLILVQLFFATSMTIVTYSLPAETLQYVTAYSDVSEQIDLEGVSEDIQGSLESQTSLPVVELGALLFYSGNIIVDLLLNFMFAIPEMIGLLLNSIMFLFGGMDVYMLAAVELFSSVAIGAMYVIGLIQLLTGVRSGSIAA